MQINKYIIIGILLNLSLIVVAQDKDSSATFLGIDLTKERKLTILPTIYLSPETNWAFGVSALTYQPLNKKDTVSPLSIAGLSFVYTLNKQILFTMPFNLFLKKDSYRVRGEISFYKYPYFFTGIGNNSSQFNNNYSEDYDAIFPRFEITALKKIKKNIFTGPKLFYQSTTINAVQKNGILETQNLPGATGSVTTGVGWEFVFDKRDFIYAPTKGFYADISFVGFNKLMGGNFEYNYFTTDLRKYFNLGKNHIIALQAYNTSIFGIAPFNKLSQLGGNKIMRGYKKGVLRDNHLLATQIEYRTPIWHFIGLAAFAGFGGVTDKLKEINLHYFVPSYGGGFRLAFNKKERVHIRFDYARGYNNKQEFYLTFAESF